MNTRALFRWSLAIVMAVGLVGVIGLALNPPAQARTPLRAASVYDWPSVLPPCNTSLQQCLDAAVVLPGDEIHIRPGVYTQSVTLLKPVSLLGSNPQTTILNAERGQRVLTVTGNITSSVIISGLTFAHGSPSGAACPEACGGGILIGSAARPTLQNIALEQNSASQGGGLWVDAGPSLQLFNVAFISNTVNGLNAFGGGAFVNGFVQLDGGRFVNNTGSGEVPAGGGLFAMGAAINGTQFLSNSVTGSSGNGGGMYLSSGPNSLANVMLINNQGAWGGAIYAGGLLSLTDAIVLNNTALNYGGGVYGNFGNLIVTRGRYEGNSAGLGGAFYATGPLTLMAARLAHNSATNGGGVYAGSTIWVTNTFFIDNAAQNGGGLYQSPAGDAYIVNALFARNVANPNQAAAIAFAATGSLSMAHSTIVDNVRNPASAVVVDNGNGGADIRDTIIAGHAVGIELVSGGAYEDYNLYFNNTTNITGPVTPGGKSLPNSDPQFADPANDDYHLRFTSPAINAGSGVGVNFDIDGQPRPIGPQVDIGFDESASTIQQLIDATPPGGSVNIPPGVYTESLNLYKPVNLIGAGPGATIIQAIAGDRVMTVTGPITPLTQIADLSLTGGSVIGGGFERAGGGVLITGTAYPSFNNVQISGNSADFGGGLYVYSGGAVLSNTILYGNAATQSGGGAYVVEPTAILEQFGGMLAYNTAKDGAGVFVQSGQFQQNGGVIFNNFASNWGGGMLIGSGGSIKLLAGQVMSNSAQQQGGGLFVDVGQATLENTIIADNVADTGGGIYVRDYTGTAASLIGGTVENNHANSYGGGVYAASTTHITGTRFFGNSAYDGSAVEVDGTAQVRLINAFIGENEANGAFPSTNASVRFDSSANSVVFHTTFGNGTQPLTRALVVNNGVVTVANTIVTSYTNGLSQFGGRLAEDYNLFYATPVTASGSISSGGHSLVGPDPLFKDVINRDYHIKGLSPAVNRGTNVGVRRDIDLDARPLGGSFDIGADEASVAGTTAGPNTGGSFVYTTTGNSTINVNIPAGAVTQTTAIYCSLIPTNTVQPPHSFAFAGVVFELDANTDPVNVLPGSIGFNVPVTLSVSYTDAQLAAAGITDELTLQLYRFEPTLNDWRPIGYRPGETQTLDVDNNLITATVLGFSRWGTAGKTASSWEVFLPLVLRN